MAVADPRNQELARYLHEIAGFLIPDIAGSGIKSQSLGSKTQGVRAYLPAVGSRRDLVGGISVGRGGIPVDGEASFAPLAIQRWRRLKNASAGWPCEL